MKIIKEVYSEEETYTFANSLAKECNGGEVFCLDGDLGVGKTIFSKGFANGIEILENINSPTFAIVIPYIGRLKLNHFDIYRIDDVEELYDIGFDEYLNDYEAVSLIEWGSKFRELLPNNTIFVKIEKDLFIGENFRRIIIETKEE